VIDAHYLSRAAGFRVISRVHACDRAAKDFMPLRNLVSIVLGRDKKKCNIINASGAELCDHQRGQMEKLLFPVLESIYIKVSEVTSK